LSSKTVKMALVPRAPGNSLAVGSTTVTPLSIRIPQHDIHIPFSTDKDVIKLYNIQKQNQKVKEQDDQYEKILNSKGECLSKVAKIKAQIEELTESKPKSFQEKIKKLQEQLKPLEVQLKEANRKGQEITDKTNEIKKVRHPQPQCPTIITMDKLKCGHTKAFGSPEIIFTTTPSPAIVYAGVAVLSENFNYAEQVADSQNSEPKKEVISLSFYSEDKETLNFHKKFRQYYIGYDRSECGDFYKYLYDNRNKLSPSSFGPDSPRYENFESFNDDVHTQRETNKNLNGEKHKSKFFANPAAGSRTIERDATMVQWRETIRVFSKYADTKHTKKEEDKALFNLFVGNVTNPSMHCSRMLEVYKKLLDNEIVKLRFTLFFDKNGIIPWSQCKFEAGDRFVILKLPGYYQNKTGNLAREYKTVFYRLNDDEVADYEKRVAEEKRLQLKRKADEQLTNEAKKSPSIQE